MLVVILIMGQGTTFSFSLAKDIILINVAFCLLIRVC